MRDYGSRFWYTWSKMDHPWAGDAIWSTPTREYVHEGGRGRIIVPIQTYAGIWHIEDDWFKTIETMAVEAENILRALAAGRTDDPRLSSYEHPEGTQIQVMPLGQVHNVVPTEMPKNIIIVRTMWEIMTDDEFDMHRERVRLYGRFGVLPVDSL
mgnify:CR=1 FL=1